jgi:acyl-CoA dehydrogenase
MDFIHSDKVKALQDKLQGFMDSHVYPNEARHAREIETGDRWQPTALMEELKAKAKLEGLWNLFLPHSPRGAGLSNLEYAPLCEIMGRSPMASEAFNCSAPDTGNMETLELYGSEDQKEQWLTPCSPERSAPASP